MTPGPAARSGAGLPEATLIARAQAGDVAAFEELAHAHADRLYAFLTRLLGSRADAEDVAQETLLRAWRGIPGFRGRSTFSTWLYRIAVNEANRSLARRTRRPATPIDEPGLQVAAASSEEPPIRAERSELRNALRRALGELPYDQRAAIVLRDVEGLSTARAADIVGIGEAAFKSRLHQARLKIRAALGDETLVRA